MTDGKKDGDWLEYYANGNKRREGRYKNGVKEGHWILYHPNGNVKSACFFRNGLYEGHYAAYHPNGNVFREGHYGKHQGNSYDGKKEGVWRDYAEDGKTLRQQIIYKHGKKIEHVIFDAEV